MKTKNMDLTKGQIWKQLFLFALPLLGASLIQQLYNTVDLLFVGNFIGKEASAAIGSSSLIVTCMIGFFTGMSVGAGVVVAKAIGERDQQKVNQHVHTAIGIALLGGCLLILLGYIGAPYFLQWIGTPREIMRVALTYLRIYFISIVSIVVYNLGAGIIRAMGDSKSPMLIQLAGGIINVIMNTLFIVVLQLGVTGAAYATLFSQTAAAIMVLYYLARKSEICQLKLRKISLSKESMIAIFKIGVPAGLQSIIITFSNIIVQSQINQFGVDTMAAFAAYFKVELLIYLPIVAFGQAMTTFAGQNIGAGNPKRVRQGTKICTFMGMGFAVVAAGLLIVFGEHVFRLFNNDATVVNYGMQIIKITFPCYWIYVIMEVFASALRGQGKAVAPLILTVTNLCVLRTAVLFGILTYVHDIRGVAVTYPLSWAATAIGMYVYFKRDSKKQMQTEGEVQFTVKGKKVRV